MSSASIQYEQLERTATRAVPDLPKELVEAFDHACRHYLKMSGVEFLRRYDSGGYRPDEANIPLTRVLMMVPLVRPNV